MFLLGVNAFVQHPPLNARTFNGTSDYYNLPLSVATGFNGSKAITIEYWFQGTSLQNAISLRSDQPGSGNQPSFLIVSGFTPANPMHILSNEMVANPSVNAFTYYGLKINTPTSNIYDGNSHHIAMTWEQGKPNGFKSYVDGVVVDQRASANVPLPDLRAFVPTVGAANVNGKLQDFTRGQIGRIRIWKIARTETEINESRNQDEDYPASANLLYQNSSILSPSNFNLVNPPAIPATPMTFNGTTNVVNLPRTVSLGVSGKNAITIEYWFRGKNLQSAVRIQNGNDFIIAGYGNNNLKPTHVISSDGGFLSGVKINNDQTHVIDDNWHHIAMVWEQNKPDGFRSFVDGKLVEQRASANVALPNLINVVPTVGAYDNNGVKVEFADGQIGRVRIWNVAQPLAAIKASMSQFTDYPSSPTLVYQGINSGTVSITSQPAVAQPPVSVTPVRFMTLSPTPITLDLPVKVSDDISEGNAVTIEYWFKGKNIQSTVRIQNGSEFIVAGWGDTKDPVHIISTDGSIAGGVKINNSTKGVDVNDAKWHHVAMTWQANDKFKSYVDGALVSERNAANVKLPKLSGVVPVVGAYLNNGVKGEFTDGDVGRIRIWKVARTEAQIKESKDRVANYPTDPNLLYQQ